MNPLPDTPNLRTILSYLQGHSPASPKDKDQGLKTPALCSSKKWSGCRGQRGKGREGGEVPSPAWIRPLGLTQADHPAPA